MFPSAGVRFASEHFLPFFIFVITIQNFDFCLLSTPIKASFSTDCSILRQKIYTAECSFQKKSFSVFQILLTPRKLHMAGLFPDIKKYINSVIANRYLQHRAFWFIYEPIYIHNFFCTISDTLSHCPFISSKKTFDSLITFELLILLYLQYAKQPLLWKLELFFGKSSFGYQYKVISSKFQTLKGTFWKHFRCNTTLCTFCSPNGQTRLETHKVF